MLTCSLCREAKPESDFRPSNRVVGARCKACHSREEAARWRYFSGLGPAEALEEVWSRLQRGRRIPKLLQQRVDRLVSDGGAAAA